MTDTHTHILPHMDDGSRSVEMSLDMLRRERDQGVTTVALTPHMYRTRELPEDFLARRAASAETLREAIAALPAEERDSLPRLCLGAEVAWVPGMAEWPNLREFCYEGTDYLLVEPPLGRWDDRMPRELYDLMDRTGIVPVIAHIDRYFDRPAGALEELFSLGVPVQLSAEALLHFFGRRRALHALEDGIAQVLISDCHNLDSRPPNLGPALAVVRQKLGDGWARDLAAQSDEIIP